jgi:hypothetical protein
MLPKASCWFQAQSGLIVAEDETRSFSLCFKTSACFTHLFITYIKIHLSGNIRTLFELYFLRNISSVFCYQQGAKIEEISHDIRVSNINKDCNWYITLGTSCCVEFQRNTLVWRKHTRYFVLGEKHDLHTLMKMDTPVSCTRGDPNISGIWIFRTIET